MQAEFVTHVDLTAKQSKWIYMHHIHLIVSRSWTILLMLKKSCGYVGHSTL